jgi:hypothetical protein
MLEESKIKLDLLALRLVLTGILGLFAIAPGQSLAIAAMLQSPNVAFYYQKDLPVDELQAFDVVVIDPTQASIPSADLAPHTSWFARLDVRGLDMGGSRTPKAYVEQTVGALWGKGYRGFLLDDGAGLDEDAPQADQWLGMVIKTIHATYPHARLMLRNHLSLARVDAADLYSVVVDSLYSQPHGYGSFLASVTGVSRARALVQIKDLQTQSSLPVVAVDYCVANGKTCRRELAKKLLADGVMPFVTAPGMGTVGIGRIEVMPRKVLLMQVDPPYKSLDSTTGLNSIALPLNYLGYDVQYADINGSLPTHISSDRYAGIVVMIEHPVRNAGAWQQWLLSHIRDGLRVAVFEQFGFPIDARTAAALNLDVGLGRMPSSGTPRIVTKAPMMGFETMPAPKIQNAVGIRVDASGRSLLRLQVGEYVYDAAGLTPWGGFTLTPYTVVSLDSVHQNRWAIQPIDFIEQTLDLPEMPVPDVTSENGRRLMYTHVDGDGFASRGEFPGATHEYSGEILYKQIFTRYKIPMTVSVIEGEIGSEGLHPDLTSTLEPIARKIFALPNVEIGSHTFSHPFYMEQIDNTTGKRYKGLVKAEWRGDTPFSLPIPNYVFDMNREIQGSIDYINRHLAPPGKSVVVIQWPGDAAVPLIGLRDAAKAGVLNINGGDTTINKSDATWTNIAPYGVTKGDRLDDYQVYASDMNEEIFTNNWLGPFYGFDRILETFALTDHPIRFKPINIYYHLYSGTKAASLKALHTVFDSVLKQPVFPIFTSEYLKRVLDWRRVSVARAGDHWIVRSGHNLRELRWPGKGVPDMTSASNVSGYMQGPGGLYIHMGDDEVSFKIVPEPSRGVVYIAQASGFIRQFMRDDNGIRFDFGGYYKPFVEMSDAGGCRGSVDGKPTGSASKTGILRLAVSGHAAKPVSYHSIEVNCG